MSIKSVFTFVKNNNKIETINSDFNLNHKFWLKFKLPRMAQTRSRRLKNLNLSFQKARLKYSYRLFEHPTEIHKTGQW